MSKTIHGSTSRLHWMLMVAGVAGHGWLAAAEACPRGGGGGFINRWDRDGDGVVSSEEFNGRTERFADFDANQDGVIDETEAPMGSQPPSRRRGPRGGRRGFVERFDADGDGAVAWEEFKGRVDAHFDRLDVDGDGTISEDELPQARTRRMR